MGSKALEKLDKHGIDRSHVAHAKHRNLLDLLLRLGLCKLIRKVFASVPRLVKHGITVIHTLWMLANGGAINDKTYLGERVIQLLVAQSEGSRLGDLLTGFLIKSLWSELRHPPNSYLGDEHRYRTADGHNNNVTLPNLGRAGSAYARSVRPMKQLPAALPDASTIFDSLFARDGQAKEHPNGISSALFYLATVITHDLFLTNNEDPSKVENSSYLDLSPLYGNNQAQQEAVRTFMDGKLKPDTFADARILGLPPGVCVLLICFNRFHNHIATELAIINEGNRFIVPVHTVSTDEQRLQKALCKRDNDLFQTARLITCGLYINILFFDYLKTILNLNRSKTSWTIDPRKSFIGTDMPYATGNQTSVEFNLIYRWHSAVSARDEKWANSFFKKVFPTIDPREMSSERFIEGMKDWGKAIDKDPGRREFGGLRRDESGALGARNVPTVLKAAEMLGIEQGRKWQVATLNEFREFFNLQPHKTFLDINQDPDIAKSLEILYGHPDHVELYPGLVAEETKEAVEGQGLCLGFTVSKTILSDAIALVRGDRFCTEEFNPASLTHWGFQQVSADSQIAGGGVMYRLLMKAFPGSYSPDSVYAIFPFTVPQETRKILQTFGEEERYDFGQPIPSNYLSSFAQNAGIGSERIAQMPNRPSSEVPVKLDIFDEQVQTASDVDSPAISEETKGTSISHMRALGRSSSRDRSPANDDALLSAKRTLIGTSGKLGGDIRDAIRDSYQASMTDSIRRKSLRLRNAYQLDAVRDVINISHADFMRRLFGILLNGPGSDVSSQAQALAAFLGTEIETIETADSLSLRNSVQEGTKSLLEALTRVCQDVKHGKVPAGGSEWEDPIRDFGIQLIKRWFDEGKGIDEVVEAAVSVAGAAVANQARGSACVLDVYLSDQYKQHWPDIERLARSQAPEAFERLKKYALEAYLLGTPVGIGATNTSTTSIDKQHADSACPPYEDSVPSRVRLDQVDLDRPAFAYEHLDRGPRTGLGLLVTTEVLAHVLRAFGKLKHLRLAPGSQGQLKTKVVDGSLTLYMNESWTAWLPYPTTKTVHFDAFENG